MNENKIPNFLEELKKANITSSEASIEAHKNMIVDNLEFIEKNNKDILTPLGKECINKLKNTKEIWLNIIEPMIGVSLALYFLFDSSIETTISTVKSYKKEFKRALISTLEIAEQIKDQRVKENSLKAADAFLEKIN